MDLPLLPLNVDHLLLVTAAPAAGSPEKLSFPVVTDPASWSCGAAAGSAAASAGSGSSCDTRVI